MFRRRRPLKNQEIHFSFDSFPDLVTNVVGIIIRLILVTWVGAAGLLAVRLDGNDVPLDPGPRAMIVNERNPGFDRRSSSA